MPRGRLIFPFLAEIARLDTAATAADPDGPSQPLTSGYDFDFREPRKIPNLTVVPAEPDSTDARVESGTIDVKVQVEPAFFEALDQLFAGVSPDSKMALVAHYKNLEADGLVDAATGEPLIRTNDRLVAIKRTNGELVRRIRNPPGLFITELRDIGHGLSVSNPHRNLLLMTFEERRQGAS